MNEIDIMINEITMNYSAWLIVVFGALAGIGGWITAALAWKWCGGDE